jgi:hypothetical protein
MTIQSWQHIIDLVRNGEPVSAEVANRAISQLVQRTEHLKDRQDAQDLAQAIYISDAPLASGVVTGNAVYFDPVINKFAAAYADIEFKDGVLQPTASSSVVGLVVYKDTADSGVIVVEGWINPDKYQDFDCDLVPMLSNMLANINHRGILYLASGAANAGRLLDKPGLLHIPVCNLVSPFHLLVRPPVTSTLNTQALKFKLNNGIAGYELCLAKGTGSTAAAFTSKPDIGAQVKVYLSNEGTVHPNDEQAVYFTGTVDKYSDFTNGNPRRIHLKDITMTKALIEALDTADGKYSDVLKPAAGKLIKIKVVGTSTSYAVAENGYSSYVAPVAYDSKDGWIIDVNMVDTSKPGWLPATSSVFENAVVPVGAKFGYNFTKDPVLQQLFPEGIVTAYLVFKNGIAISDQVVEVNASGIWWKDALLQAPWHNVGSVSILPEVQIDFAEWEADQSSKIILPSELYLAYVKLAIGGSKVVTSIDTPPNSPIVITDPQGNVANTGPLVIKAGFELTEATTSAPGSLVVKNFSGFQMERGLVVERLIAGNNIELTSSFDNGQGEVIVGVRGLDGKLEGQPDILAIDDVLVERDSVYNMFYSVFPPNKASSIIGKINVPGYLDSGIYNIQLSMTFMALHNTGNQILPPLALTWISLPNFQTKANINTARQSPTAQEIQPYVNAQGAAEAIASRDCANRQITLLENATPGSSVFFKLTRTGSSSTDTYSSKLALISISYKFVKSQ